LNFDESEIESFSAVQCSDKKSLMCFMV